MTTSATPIGDLPGIGLSDPAYGPTISEVRKTPIILYGIFVELTRQLYSGKAGFNEDLIWKWTPGKTTQLWIEKEDKFDPGNNEIRPAIFVGLSPITYKSYSGRYNNRTGGRLQEGETDYGRHGTGNVTLIHIGRESGESVQMVSQSMDYFDAFADIIRKDFCFDTFNVMQVVPSQVMKESKERNRSDLVMEYTYYEEWTLKLESAKLKRITINAGRELASVLQLR